MPKQNARTSKVSSFRLQPVMTEEQLSEFTQRWGVAKTAIEALLPESVKAKLRDDLRNGISKLPKGYEPFPIEQLTREVAAYRHALTDLDDLLMVDWLATITNGDIRSFGASSDPKRRAELSRYITAKLDTIKVLKHARA